MREFDAGQFDIAVIGAGHAGIEAALAAARLGLETVCLTINRDPEEYREDWLDMVWECFGAKGIVALVARAQASGIDADQAVRDALRALERRIVEAEQPASRG